MKYYKIVTCLLFRKSGSKTFWIEIYLACTLNRNEVIKIEAKKITTAIFYGLISIFVIAALSSLLFSLILRFTDTSEKTIGYVILFVSFISLFVGGFISGGKGKRSGWMLGGATGVLYTMIIFFYQYLGLDSLFTTKQMIYYSSYIITAMMGGVLGVNMTTKN